MAGPAILIPADASPTEGAPEPDLTLLALSSRANDPEVKRRLLEAIAPAVRKVCRGVLGNGHVDLDDTVQECLFEILRALPRFRGEGPVLHYARRITLRAAIDARKRGRKHAQTLRTLAHDACVAGPAAKHDEPFALKLVQQVIDSLPALQAETFLMRALLGFSLEEIAESSEVPVNTAKSRLRLAKETLRIRLAREHQPGRTLHNG